MNFVANNEQIWWSCDECVVGDKMMVQAHNLAVNGAYVTYTPHTKRHNDAPRNDLPIITLDTSAF